MSTCIGIYYWTFYVFCMGLILEIVCVLKSKDLTVYEGFMLVLRFYWGPIVYFVMFQ